MTPEKTPASFNRLDYALIGGAALTTLGGLSGALLSLAMGLDGAFNGTDIGMVVWMTGLFFTGLSTGLGLFFRKRERPANKKIVTAATLWWVGMALLSFGGFAMFSPGSSRTFLQNVGFAAALCFAPGGLLALAGATTFWHSQRRPKLAADTATVAEATPAQLAWTEKLARAKEYHRHITKLLRSSNVATLVADGSNLRRKLDDWQGHMQKLVERLAHLDDNLLIRRDMEEVPRAIADLKARLATESNPTVRAQMEETLRDYERQQENLEQLLAQKRRIELEMDESLATVGTIYLQMQMLASRKTSAGRRAERLMENVEHETARLRDVLDAMTDEYTGSAGA